MDDKIKECNYCRKNGNCRIPEYTNGYVITNQKCTDKPNCLFKQNLALKEKLNNISKVFNHCMNNANLMNNCNENCDYYNECNGECSKLYQVIESQIGEIE